MIDLQTVRNIHNILIERFGGTGGIRDLAGLESAINRPFQTFDKKELYPTAVEKAAAIFESIISNHPFLDGNKRTAYVLMRLVLFENGVDIKADENKKYDFVIKAAKGEIKYEQIKDWIEDNL